MQRIVYLLRAEQQSKLEGPTRAIKVGDRLPEGTLMELGAQGPAPVNVTEATKGKKIVIFGIPGAFTPT